MVKVMFFVHRRTDISHEEFRRYGREVHAPLVARIPGLRRYVLNFAVCDAEGPAPLFDGVTEVWFDHAESFYAALSSREGAEALADQTNFLDTPRVQMVMFDEAPVL